MTLEEILNEWDVDSLIPPTNLGAESLKEPKLHAKYLRWLTHEKDKLKAWEAAEAIKVKEKYEFYTQGPSKEDWKNQKWNWNSFPSKGTVNRKSELEVYLGADEDLMKVRTKVDEQRIKVETLTDIIKQIHRRSYVVSQAIADAKFKAGIG